MIQELRPVTAFIAAVLLACCSVSVAAPGDPLGPAFAVHPPSSALQENPAIAARGDGFIVAWGGTLPGTTALVHARRFTADGTPLAPFPDIEVASPENENNVAIAVAANATGQFAVLWSNFDNSDVRADGQPFIRTYSAVGAPLSPARDLDGPGQSESVEAIAAGMAASGNIVAVYERRDEIFARRFAFDASPIDSVEFPVGQRIPGKQFEPDIAVRADGSFVISWINEAKIVVNPNFLNPLSALNLNFSAIRMQPFAADATPQRRVLAVDKATNLELGIGRRLFGQAVAASDAGRFAVTWDPSLVLARDPIVVRPYSTGGFPLGLRETVQRGSTNTTDADIAMGDDGTFAVVWRERFDVSESETVQAIFVRLHDAGGEPMTPAIQLAAHPFERAPSIRPDNPAVARLTNGNYVVTWQRRTEVLFGADTATIMVRLIKGQ